MKESPFCPSAIRFLLILFVLTSATGLPAQPSQMYLSGQVGTYPAFMFLELDNIDATGWYHYLHGSAPIRLRGQIQSSGRLELNELDGSGAVSATFAGVLEQDALTGTWSDRRNRFWFSFETVATTATFAWTIGDAADVSAQYPVLSLSGRYAEAEAVLHGYATDRILNWVSDGLSARRQYWAEPSIPRYWHASVAYTITYCSPSLLSILFTWTEYTGGAHSNTGFDTMVFVGTQAGFRRQDLSGLFGSDFGYIEVLSELCLTDLRKQGAGMVRDGLITRFQEKDLQAFTVHPHAITFHFAPYHVGSYAEGPYQVSTPWSAIDGLLDENFAAVLSSDGILHR